jgi:hypothetical protein
MFIYNINIYFYFMPQDRQFRFYRCYSLTDNLCENNHYSSFYVHDLLCVERE